MAMYLDQRHSLFPCFVGDFYERFDGHSEAVIELYFRVRHQTHISCEEIDPVIVS